jgi:hypothetical protein
MKLPSFLLPAGCAPDVVLALRDCKGNTLLRLKAVKAILSAWSPVLRGALELAPNMDGSCGHGSGVVNSCQAGISSGGIINGGGGVSSAGCGTACGSAGISFLSCNGAGGGSAALNDYGAGASCTVMTSSTLSTVAAAACGSCNCALQELPVQVRVMGG